MCSDTEATLRKIIENSTNLFYMHTPDHVLTYVSPQSQQYFDCKPDEALVHWTDFITDHPINQSAIEMTQRAIDTGKRQPPYEVECISRKGRKIWVEVNETPIVENGKTVAVIGSLTDITERKFAVEKLRQSEERYRHLYKDTPVMLHSIDRDGKLVSVSNQWLEVLGYERSEVIGRRSMEFLTPSSQRYAEEIVLPEFFRFGYCKEVPYQLVKKDGEVIDVLLSAVAEKDENGEVVRSLAVMVDVTQRKQMEDDLRRSEERFRRLYRETPAMLHSIDQHGRLVSVSNYWTETLGYERSEVLGKKITEFFTEESRRYAEAIALPRFFRTGFAKEIPYQLVKKNGEIRDVLLSATLETNRHGEPIRSLAVMVDVTERLRAQKKIEKLNVELEARAHELESANKELKAFTYAVSHDLRKPLTVINCYCQIIQDLSGSSLNADCRNYLKEISDVIMGMSETIDGLLDLSCATQTDLNFVPVDLSSLAQEVASELVVAEPERQVIFKIEHEIYAKGDLKLLRVVLENLIGNAWKFSANRKDAVIEFGVADIDGEKTYFVQDNGIGFDMAQAEKLFAPFQRLPNAEVFKGHGVGLTTVDRIIRRHGGRIWVEATRGRGATFYFTLSKENF
ncbi:MAG: PAS domain S-box protein [Deltaproteobacteria bacterium]|jgi:PAS domain S-box-containing protein|nr:PAS domain S-box protein [Deltaproteobacteria bacterium]